MKKANYKKYFPLLLVIVSFIPLLNLFQPGLPITHDGQDHVARIANFYQNLVQGNLVPRWAGNLNWGYGHPILMFLYPLPSYLASLFHFLGFSLIDSTKIVFGLGILLSGVFMYLWLKEFLGEEAGLVGGILYVFAPYRFVDVYVRGDIGENLAFAFIPLVFYFLLKLTKNNNSLNLIGGSFSVALLILSHNAISLMFIPLFMLYASYLLWQANKKKLLVISFLLVVGLGFSLSAFFWAPALFEGKYTLRNIVTAGAYKDRFVSPTSLLYGHWNYGGSGLFTQQLGIIHWIAILLAPIYILFKKKDKNSLLALGLLVYSLIAIFLMLEQSSFVWTKIMLLQNFQFPWRFLAVPVFTTPVLGSLFVFIINRKIKLSLIFLLLISILFLSRNYWYAQGYLRKPESFFTGIYNGTTDTGESAPIWSVRFMEKKPKEHIEVISGEAFVKEISRKSTVHVYEIDAAEKSRIVENTLYFPGWSVDVDKRAVDIEFQDPLHRGLMTFFVNKGKHNVEIKFGETKLRFFADMISTVALGVIILLFFPNVKR